MLKTLKRLQSNKLISPPPWLIDNTQYLVMTGSVAYGCSTDMSDRDIHGFCIENKESIAPNRIGKIVGFDHWDRFDQWQQHHIEDPSKGVTWDFTVFGLIKYFNLLMQSNPDSVEILFVDRDCVLHSSPIAEFIRTNRHFFLSKDFSWRCRQYGHSQLSKMDRVPVGKRLPNYQKYGFDTKYASHAVRLCLQARQVLEEGTLNLRQNSELLKSIRRGEKTLDWIRQRVSDEERYLDSAEKTSELPLKVNRGRCREILLEAISMHYGTDFLTGFESSVDSATRKLEKIKTILNED